MKQTRKQFLKTIAIGSVGLAAGISAKSYGRILGANDRLNFAVVGLRSRAYAHLAGIKSLTNTSITHIADVDSRELEKFSNGVNKKFGTTPIKEKDFRKILEAKDVDIVTIASPDHWHATMAIMALQAGKHVFVEKPCSHNPHEGEMIIAAQKKFGKVVQMGNQHRSAELAIEAMNRIHGGLIGDTYFGKAWYTNNRKSIGIGKPAPVPDYLDWDLWQGPAPRVPYKDNIHPYNWHWFFRWGTGESLNNGTHEVDLCRWALNVGYPDSVTSTGGRYHDKDDWEFYDTLVTNFKYKDKMISWDGLCCNDKKYYGRSRGIAVYGTKGVVILDRQGYEVYDLEDHKLEERTVQDKNTTKDLQSIDSMTDAHFRNFVNAIQNGEKLHSPIEEGNVAVTMLHLSNISWRVGRTLNLNNSDGHILNDAEAMQLWKRQYEKGWEL